MNTSTLCPPNHHLMSDSVISTVAKHSKRGQVLYGEEVDSPACHGYSKLQDGHYPTPSAHRGVAPANPWQCNTAARYYSTSGVKATASAEKTGAVASKRQREEATNNSNSNPKWHQADYDPSLASLATVKGDVDQARIAELIRLGQDIHRKRCRESQRRYRKKQNGKLADLETSTVQLRTEVAQLEEKRNDISAAMQKKANMWNVAVEYLWLFRRGLQLKGQASPDAPPAQAQADAQLDFVQKAMAADVASNDGFGRAAAIRSWWFLQWFDDVDVDLRGLEKISDNSLTTATRTTLTITEQSLQKLFPHLSAHTLASKLVGRRISMKGSVYFEFDAHSGYVTSIIAQSDMLTPVLGLVGSLADVSLVFEKALISPNFQWKPRSIRTTG